MRKCPLGVCEGLLQLVSNPSVAKFLILTPTNAYSPLGLGNHHQRPQYFCTLPGLEALRSLSKYKISGYQIPRQGEGAHTNPSQGDTSLWDLGSDQWNIQH